MGRSPYKTGTERFVNGYVVVKQDNGDWKYKHHIIAEQKLGRELEDNERVCFKDGNRTNLDPSNVDVRWKLPPKQYQRQSHLRRRIIELKAKVKQFEDQLESEEGHVAEPQEGRGGQQYDSELLD